MKSSPRQNREFVDCRTEYGELQEARNLRKVKVNAQITSLVSTFEFLGVVIIGFIAIITSSAAAVHCLSLLLEYIALPYAFLKATSENKEQIVEHGWINTLFQTLNIRYSSNESRQQSNVLPFKVIENGSDVKISSVSENLQKKSKNEVKQKSPTGSSHCNLNVPSCENPTHSIDKDFKEKNSPSNVSCVPSTSQRADVLDLHEKIFNERYRIVNELILCVRDETSYISQFLKFIELEDSSYQENNVDEDPAQHDEMVKDRVKRLLCRDNHKERVELRGIILQKLKESIDNEHNYENLFSELMDTEEQFYGDEE